MGLSRRLLLIGALIATSAARHPSPEPDHGPPLPGDELRTLLLGKTAREATNEKALIQGNKRNIIEVYLRDEATAYLFIEGGQTIWRGRWTIQNNKLCLPGAYWPCAAFYSDGGKLYKNYNTANGWKIVELDDGDPDNIVSFVESSAPYSKAPPIR